MAELHEVDAWLAGLLSQLKPAARKKMLREVARSKKGRIRRGMFAKLKTAKYLKAQVGVDAADIAFVPGFRSWPASITTACETR